MCCALTRYYHWTYRHRRYLFANKSSTRMKVLVYDGFGIWLAARRLNKGRFIWTNGEPVLKGTRVARSIVSI
ncbi:IS66 family insertion sequence element accessory protein TnpB [Ralstonia mannitolilytica]|uniref:IS66 family insertion sequence element accessory protein TnpB n=1 Tax=Ralstonia mannitolilytica TaxID=105219 RepID=UPI003B8CFDA8